MARDSFAPPTQPPTEEAKPGPYDHLDYTRCIDEADSGHRPPRPPSTEAVIHGALGLQKLLGVPGAHALSMAVLIDQGRVAEALELEEAWRRGVEAAKQAKAEKRVRP